MDRITDCRYMTEILLLRRKSPTQTKRFEALRARKRTLDNFEKTPKYYFLPLRSSEKWEVRNNENGVQFLVGIDIYSSLCSNSFV